VHFIKEIRKGLGWAGRVPFPLVGDYINLCDGIVTNYTRTHKNPNNLYYRN
jgi:hypothetical protein